MNNRIDELMGKKGELSPEERAILCNARVASGEIAISPNSRIVCGVATNDPQAFRESAREGEKNLLGDQFIPGEVVITRSAKTVGDLL